MSNFFQTYVFQFLLFILIFGLLNTRLAVKICLQKKNFIVLSVGLLLIQIVSIVLIKKEVGDVFLFVPALGLCTLLILRNNFTFWQSCFLLILAVYLVIPNWGVQYLFWIWPFLYLVDDFVRKKDVLVFNLISSFYLFLNYGNIVSERLIFPTRIIFSVGFCLWLFILYWFVKQLNRVKPKAVIIFK